MLDALVLAWTVRVRKEHTLRSTILMTAVLISLGSGSSALAQSGGAAPAQQGAACPPDVKGGGPTVGSGSSGSLSDKLAQSKGVICPPAGLDREMQVKPPSGGEIKVIPAPGTPGGDQSVQPK